MSIVINTPTSHIGRALAARLLDAGESVTVLSRGLGFCWLSGPNPPAKTDRRRRAPCPGVDS
jgi:nucleoside-diphosphate-sugar epimerase